jgi:hypothetical protein
MIRPHSNRLLKRSLRRKADRIDRPEKRPPATTDGFELNKARSLRLAGYPHKGSATRASSVTAAFPEEIIEPADDSFGVQILRPYHPIDSVRMRLSETMPRQEGSAATKIFNGTAPVLDAKWHNHGAVRVA